jgi:hypothetical protein
MKARIKLAPNVGRPGYYGLIPDEEEYEGVKEGRLAWEETKRVTHILVPRDIFARLVALDRSIEDKPCGRWEPFKNDQVVGARCSHCKAEAKVDKEDKYILSSFCPECGADLREVNINGNGGK